MQLKKFLVLIALLIFPLLVNASDCLDVNGLSFEKIDSNKLLAIRSGKNIAIIWISYPYLPDRIGTFRFFSEKLCKYGAENQFHIDGKLYTVSTIELYKF
jgi:hypothetical protein